MSADKKVNPSDFPQEWKRTTTQQPEEYIDKSNIEKDEDDKTGRPPADSSEETRRRKGDQETA